MFKGDDAGGAADGGRAVRDDEGGPAAHEILEGAEDFAFGGGVQGASGFVKNKDGRVLEEGAGDGDALAFAAGQGGAAFADEGLEFFRVMFDEGAEARGLGGGGDFLGGRAGFSEGDVFGDGNGEEKRLLQDHGDLAAQAGQRKGADVVAVELDAPLPRIEEARG